MVHHADRGEFGFVTEQLRFADHLDAHAGALSVQVGVHRACEIPSTSWLGDLLAVFWQDHAEFIQVCLDVRSKLLADGSPRSAPC